jgi:hypothetical protein
MTVTLFYVGEVLETHKICLGLFLHAISIDMESDR